jgi:hypothetical protein
MHAFGDTCKDFLARGGWPDNTQGNSMFEWVWAPDYVKTGQFGGVRADGTTYGWDPATGNPSALTSAQLAPSVAAVVGYAVAKGDDRALQANQRVAAYSGAVKLQNM